MPLTKHRIGPDGDYAISLDGEVVAHVRRDVDAGAPSVAVWDWELTPEAAAQVGRSSGWGPTLRDAVEAVDRALR